VAALLQFCVEMVRRGGRKRWRSKLGMECDAVVVAERLREEENGVAMVALRSCDGGAAEKMNSRWFPAWR